MRRLIVLALTCALGLGGLTACGKKSPPRLPGGEELRVRQGAGGTRDQSIGVAPAKDEEEVDLSKPDYQEAPAEPAPGTKPPPESSVDDGGAEVAPEQGLPPSPGGPQEGGF